MICPYCAENFPLTWRRYLGAPLSRHVCPRCGRISRLSLSVAYFAAAIGLIASIMIAAMLLGYALEGRIGWYTVAIFAAGSVVGAAADKWFDENLRKLRRMAP